MSICVISQPRFFPGLHYLHRMMIADMFVILDNVQFNPRHEENRAKIKTPNGPRWLTAPTHKRSREQLICETEIDNRQPWRRKAAETIRHLYGKAPYYDRYAPVVLDILEQPYELLSLLDRATWEPALQALQIACKFVYASKLPVSGEGYTLLLNICTHLDADTYVSGAFGRDYLDLDAFARRGIAVRYHDYQYPVYPQLHGAFVPYLSYIDMLLNTGLEQDAVRYGGILLSD